MMQAENKILFKNLEDENTRKVLGEALCDLHLAL